MTKAEEMYLIVGTMPETNWHSACAIFEQAGYRVSNEPLDACSQNCEEHAANGGRFLILHNHPEEAIARIIGKGIPPLQAKELWINAAKLMISFYKRHRTQAMFVFLPNLLTDPETQLAIIEEDFGLPQHALPVTSSGVNRPPPLERRLANELLQQSPEIDALMVEIEASTSNMDVSSHCASDFNFAAASHQLSTLKGKLEESEQPNARLQRAALQHFVDRPTLETTHKLVLNAMSEDLRNAESTCDKLKEKLAEQQKQHISELNLQAGRQEALRSDLAEVTSQWQKYQRESCLLLEQLHVVQEELEEKHSYHSQLQEQLAQVEIQTKADRDKICKMENALESSRKSAKELISKKDKELCQALSAVKGGEEQISRLNSESKNCRNQHSHALKSVKELVSQKDEELRQALSAVNGGEERVRRLNSESKDCRSRHSHALKAANSQIEFLQTELNSLTSNTLFKATASVKAKKAKPQRHIRDRELTSQVKLIKQSGLFNERFYLNAYPDVAENGIDPVLHYLMSGANERRNPSEDFDTDWYLTNHPDVRDVGMNPLLHYCEFGETEGRLPNRNGLPAP